MEKLREDSFWHKSWKTGRSIDLLISVGLITAIILVWVVATMI